MEGLLAVSAPGLTPRLGGCIPVSRGQNLGAYPEGQWETGAPPATRAAPRDRTGLPSDSGLGAGVSASACLRVRWGLFHKPVGRRVRKSVVSAALSFSAHRAGRCTWCFR